MTELTKAQQRALDWFKDRGGEGVIDRYGRVVAAGEMSKYLPATWLRLVALGYIEGDAGRLLVVRRSR